MMDPAAVGPLFRAARLSDPRERDAACARLRVVKATVSDAPTTSARRHRRKLNAVEARQRLRALTAELDAARFGLAGPRDS